MARTPKVLIAKHNATPLHTLFAATRAREGRGRVLVHAHAAPLVLQHIKITNEYFVETGTVGGPFF